MTKEQQKQARTMHSDYVAYECIVHGGHGDNKNSGCYKDGHRDFQEFMIDEFPAALDYIEQLEARLAEAIEDFHDYATQGHHNFAPFCKNADKDCVDARGWCIDKNCKGRLYSGFSDKPTPCQEGE